MEEEGRQAAQYTLRRSWGRDSEGERSGTCGKTKKSDKTTSIIGWSSALGDPDASVRVFRTFRWFLIQDQTGLDQGWSVVASNLILKHSSVHWGKGRTFELEDIGEITCKAQGGDGRQATSAAHWTGPLDYISIKLLLLSTYFFLTTNSHCFASAMT